MTRPIRVLQVMASLDRGGAEAVVMSWYRSIDRTKVQFDFVVNDRETEYAYELEIMALGGRVHHLPRYTLSNHLSYTRSWHTLLRQHPEWRVIHAHHTSPAAIYLALARKYGRSTIAHSHIAGADRSWKGLLKILARWPLRYIADNRLSCSSDAARWMFGTASVDIIPNAIDIEKYSFSSAIREEVRHEFGLDDRLVVGHVGRFSTQKNHTRLVEIFNLVHQQTPHSTLLLVGDGELRETIQHRAIEMGLRDCVQITGARSDVADLLQGMDVFLFPSLYEGLGVAVVEAQASGLPCIVSDNVPHEVKLTDRVTFISLNESSHHWAETVLKNASSDDRRASAEAVRIAGYDVAETARTLERYYTAIVGNSRSDTAQGYGPPDHEGHRNGVAW